MGKFTTRLVLVGSKSVEFHGPADITHETTDAIVNAANSSLLGGGGVDGAIHRAGGPAILEACRQIVARIGRLPAGKAVITTGGRLPAQHVIHTVGPIHQPGHPTQHETLASCYRESLRLAEEQRLKSIAFPSISTGAYGYPVAEAAEIAITAVVGSLKTTTHVSHVRFVLFDAATLGAYVAAAQHLTESDRSSSLQIEKAS